MCRPNLKYLVTFSWCLFQRPFIHLYIHLPQAQRSSLPFESMPTCSCRSMTLLSMCLTSHIQISSVHWKEQSTTRSWWRDDLSVFSALSKAGRAGTRFENPLSLSHPFWCLSVCLSLSLCLAVLCTWSPTGTYIHSYGGCSWILAILE